MHIFTTKKQPATNYIHSAGFRIKYPPKKRIRACCCNEVREARFLGVQSYYDGDRFYCVDGKGCKRPRKNAPKIKKTWYHIKSRCKFEEKYKKLGITKDWLIFENFYRDMGDPPTPYHSIDRIDNNKGYSKENCRWATQRRQSLNKSNNKKLSNAYKDPKGHGWNCRIKVNNKTYHIGYFDTELEAHCQYLSFIKSNPELL